MFIENTRYSFDITMKKILSCRCCVDLKWLLQNFFIFQIPFRIWPKGRIAKCYCVILVILGKIPVMPVGSLVWMKRQQEQYARTCNGASVRTSREEKEWLKGSSPAPRKLSWPRTVHEPGPFTGILHKSSATLSWLDTYFQTRTCQPNLIRGFTQYPPKTHCPWENSST